MQTQPKSVKFSAGRGVGEGYEHQFRSRGEQWLNMMNLDRKRCYPSMTQRRG
jgi:hypothetical protein